MGKTTRRSFKLRANAYTTINIQLRPVVPNFERLHYANLLRLKNRRMSVSRDHLCASISCAKKNNVEHNEAELTLSLLIIQAVKQ